MAEGLGLLASAQSAATRIPYENIESNQKGLSGMLNAFQIAANVNRQRQALEQHIHEQNLRMMLSEQESSRKIDQMNLSATMQMARFNEQKKMDDYRAQDMAIDNKRMQSAMEFSQGTKVAGEAATQRLADDFAHAKNEPGTPGFTAELPDILARNSAALATPGGRQMARFFGGAHNQTAAQQAAALNAQQSALDLEIERTTGMKTNIIDSPWKAQEKWIPDPTDPKKQRLITEKDPKTGEPVRTGQMFIPLPPTKEDLQLPTDQQKPRWLTVDGDQLSDWHQRKKSIQEGRKKLPGQINAPDLGVNPIPVQSNTVVDTPTKPTPSQRDIDVLLAHPDKAKKFEAKFGAGTASAYLQ